MLAAAPVGHVTVLQHRARGDGRNVATASSICWNSVRGTITSAIWNVIERPWQTILAPIFTNRSRNVVMDQWLTASGTRPDQRAIFVGSLDDPTGFKPD